MGRKPKNRANAPAVEPTADQVDNTASAEATTMGAFERRADRDKYLSIRQAAQHIYGSAYEPKNDQTVRNAAKKRDEFKASGALINVTVEGYEIPPLTYLHIDAINAFHAANLAGGSTRGGPRNGRGGVKRYVLRVTPEQKAMLEALFADQEGLTGLAFEAASTPKPRKNATSVDTTAASASEPTAGDDTPVDAVSSDQPPADMFDVATGGETNFDTPDEGDDLVDI